MSDNTSKTERFPHAEFPIECDHSLNTLNEYNEFAYVVSHDLQSPIRQLKGFADCLLDTLGPLTPEQQTYKDMINHVTDQAGKTLDALLVFSRLNTDTKQFASLDTHTLIKDTLFKLGTNRKSFKGTIHLPLDIPVITGDYDLMVQAFYHIIGNAIKFQPKGQNPIINISYDNINGQHRFCIQDNGIGMDPAKSHNAFIILRKLVPEKDYPGRGAGLAFAKKIVEIHKGKIWLETEPGKGTSVYFTIGLKPEDTFKPTEKPCL